jgi:hypothetical protein
MNVHFERRKSSRERIDSAVELIWKDESGQRRFECGQMVDCSREGAGIASPQPLPVSTKLILRAPVIGALVFSVVRSCSWRRTQYHVGVEFIEKASFQPSGSLPEADYHELIRAGVAGDSARVEQLYRNFAFRYHPDNRDTGNSEVFLRLREMYQLLSSSGRFKPEAEIAKPFQEFSWREGLRGLKDNYVSVLGVLCRKRMDDFRNATVSQSELESLTRLTTDELGFILWYLREKGAVTLSEGSSDYAISATGVEMLETACRPA